MPVTSPSKLPLLLLLSFSADHIRVNSPADVQVLREAFKFARRLSQTAPFSEYVISELSPGSAVSTDGECILISTVKGLS